MSKDFESFFGLDDEAGGWRTGLDAEVGAGGGVGEGGLALGAFGAEVLELAEAAHVALAPGGDAAREPALFCGEMGVEPVERLFFGGFDGFGPF